MNPATFQPGDAVDVRVATPAGPVWRPAVVVGYRDGEERIDLRYADAVGFLFGCDVSSIRPALPVRL